MIEQRFQIAGMDCADCARTVEKGVARLDEVESAALNFTTGTLCVRGPVAAERVVGRVRELGYDVEEGQESGGAGGRGRKSRFFRAPLRPCAPALLPLFHVIAQFPHPAHDALGRHRAAHAQRAGGEVERRRLDLVQPGDALLNGSRAVGAIHTSDLKALFNH